MSGGGYGQPSGFGSGFSPSSNRFSAFGGMPNQRQQFFSAGPQQNMNPGLRQQGAPSGSPFWNPTTGMMERSGETTNYIGGTPGWTGVPRYLPSGAGKPPQPETGGIEPMPYGVPPSEGNAIQSRLQMYRNYGVTGPQLGQPYAPNVSGQGGNVQSPTGGTPVDWANGGIVATRGGMGMTPNQFSTGGVDPLPPQRQAPAGYYYNQDGAMLLGSNPMDKARAPLPSSRPPAAGSIPNDGLRPTGPTDLAPQYNIGRPPPIGTDQYWKWARIYGGGGDNMAAPQIPWGPGNPVYDSIAMTYPGR